MVEFLTPRYINLYVYGHDYSGAPIIKKTGYGDGNLFRGKYLVFGLSHPPSWAICDTPDSTETVSSIRKINSVEYPFIYVAPECKTSRDALRNSGFHIVRNREKASVVLLPELKETVTYNFNICIIENEITVNLFSISDVLLSSIKEDKVQTIEDNIINKLYSGDRQGLVIRHGDKLEKQIVCAITKCEDFKYLWDTSKENTKFGFEKDLKLTPSIEVTPELFAVWDKCNDTHVIACALAQCDWQKYPTTLAYYLWKNKTSIRYAVNSSQDYILKQIGFYQLYNNNTCDNIVEPEDWNMLQKCKLYKLGLPENGGLVKCEMSGGKFQDIPIRVQVKPLYITEPAKFENLIAAANNM